LKALSISPRLLAIPLLTLAVFLAGCAGSPSVGTSWPGITVYPATPVNAAAEVDASTGAIPAVAPAPAAVATSQTIYMAYHKVYAIDPANGKMKWVFPTPPATLSGAQAFYAPPAVSDDLIVVTDYVDTVFALSPDTGENKWYFKPAEQKDRSRFVGGAAIGDKYVYVASVNGVVRALNKKDGTEAHIFKAADQVWATPLLDGDTLYVASFDRHIYALDAATLSLKWKFPDKPEDAGDPPMGPIVSTPTLHKGILYFGSFNYHVYALDTATRQVRWKYDTTNWVWSSPVYDEVSNRLIGADLDGHIFALNPEDGSPAWKVDAVPSSRTPIVGAPLLATRPDTTRVVYITVGGGPTEPNLLTLKTDDGTEAKSPNSLQATFDNAILFIPLDPTQRVIPIFAPPVAANDLLLLGAQEGKYQIYALDSATFENKWQFNSTQAEDDAKKASPPPADQGGLFGNSTFTTVLLIGSLFVLLLTFLTNRRQGGKGK